METQVLSNESLWATNETTESSALLKAGVNINSYIIESKIPTESGEAEIFLCSKDNEKFILKYYLNCNPKKEIIEKIKNFNNPNIVSLYEYGMYKDHFYEILEYAEGGALDSKDSQGKYKYLPVNEETALQIVRETINAFTECHKAGIIHRDIKPGNLFYKNKEGSNILVGDFGISSSFDVEDGMTKHLTQTTARTEGYTAPEVYSGVIGPEIDYYSLGVTIWELLTGKNPFITLDGKTMFTASIIKNTIQGKMADILISRAPELSQRMQTLIKGLMTIRHEKRWDYDKVTNFLNGEDVPVYSDVNQLPPVEVGGVVCSSYKEIAEAIIDNIEEGKKFVYKGNLARYLVKIDKDFAMEISDKVDEYSLNQNLDEGVFYIAHKLCPNFEFYLTSKNSICSIPELISALETRPSDIMPYLNDSSKNLYTYMKVMGWEEIAKKIGEISENSENEYLLIQKIILALKGNAITPFIDGVNDKIVLSDIEQINNLSKSLKERLLLKIDAYDKNVCAWLENMTGTNINEWRENFSFEEIPSEKMVISRWNLFSACFLKNEIKAIDLSKKEFLIDFVKSFIERKKIKISNTIIEKTWRVLFDRSEYRLCYDLLDLISEKTTGLSKNLQFFAIQKAICLYELREYLGAYGSLVDVDCNDSEKFLQYKYLAFSLNKLELDQNESLLEFADKALEFEPDNYELLKLKGKALYKLDRYKEAAATYTVLLDMKKDRGVYNKRALCYEALAKDGAPDLKKKARADKKSASNIDPTNFSYEFEQEFGNRRKLSDTKNVVTVGTSDNCNFGTIQQAIDSVEDGTTIHVLPGIYKEDLNFTKSVNLVGCEDYIAEKSSRELPVVVLSKEYSCKIDIPVNMEGIAFTQKQDMKFDNLSNYLNEFEDHEYEKFCESILTVNTGCKLRNMAVLNGVDRGIIFLSGTSVLEYSFVGKTRMYGLACCEKSSLKIKYTNVANCEDTNVIFFGNTTAELDNCNIHNSQRLGFLVRDDSECLLEGCYIYNNWQGGFYDGNSKGSVTNCEIYNSRGTGVFIGCDATPSIADCEIHNNERTGVDIGGDATPSIADCEIQDNKANGIVIKGSAKPEITGCKIHDNESVGVAIKANAIPSIADCEIQDNKANGINIEYSAKPEITGCKIHDNTTEGEFYPGVVAEGDSSPAIRDCEIYNHLAEGLRITDNAGGSYKNCKIHNNESTGVCIWSHATPSIADCEIHDNKANGINIEDSAKPEITGCKIHDNKTEGKLYPGVVAKGDSSPAIRDCEIYNHLAYGLWIKESAGGTYKDCKIHDNKSGGIDNETSKSVDTSSCKCWGN